MAGGELEPDDLGRTAPWDLAEIVGVGLVAVIAILFVFSLVSALLTAIPQPPEPTHLFSLGITLQRLTVWTQPSIVPFFLFGSLGLAWWQIETWVAAAGSEEPAIAFHLRRARLIVKADQVASVLCFFGGVLSVIGNAMESPPDADWSGFIFTLGLALATIVVSAVGFVATRRLLDIHTSDAGVAVTVQGDQEPETAGSW